jgi:hypothetical protein
VSFVYFVVQILAIPRKAPTMNRPPARENIRTHCLKTIPEYFDALIGGGKTFEIRSAADRHFRVGDILNLEEWNPDTEGYTGNCCAFRVNYILRGFPGLAPDHVAMAISLHYIGFVMGAEQLPDRPKKGLSQSRNRFHV